MDLNSRSPRIGISFENELAVKEIFSINLFSNISKSYLKFKISVMSRLENKHYKLIYK